MVESGQEERAQMVRAGSRDGLYAHGPAFLDRRRVWPKDQFRGCEIEIGETRNGEIFMVECFVVQDDVGRLVMTSTTA